MGAASSRPEGTSPQSSFLAGIKAAANRLSIVRAFDKEVRTQGACGKRDCAQRFTGLTSAFGSSPHLKRRYFHAEDDDKSEPSSTAPVASSPIKGAVSEDQQAAGQLGHIGFTDGAYTGAPIPANDEARIKYVCSLNMLDTKPDPKFDSITKLCTMLFKVPVALVTLIVEDRQWFKSAQGVDGLTQTERKSSFCAWTLLPEFPEVLVVTDALEDARFARNPLVTGPPGIRFYAGCPLVTSNDMRLGSLCIIDVEPHPNFDADSAMMLANLAQMVVKEIEKDKALQEQKEMSAALTQENTQLLRAMDAFSEGIVLCNVSEPVWPVEFCNEAWQQLTGFSKEDLRNGFWSFFRIADKDPAKVQASYRAAIADQQPFDLPLYFIDTRQQRKQFTLQMRCANLENMDHILPSVGVPAVLVNRPPDQNTADGLATFYFATLTPAQLSEQGPTTPMPSQLTSGVTSGSAITSGTSSGHVLQLVDGVRDPFGDVKLGQLLGRGSYGRVYRGRWNGAQVAVKILEYDQPAPKQDSGTTPTDINGTVPHTREQVEALLSAQLSHPNVVQTYKHCTREFGKGGPQGATTMLETWMVMEFCNKGSLVDAIDRGYFRKRNAIFEPDWVAMLATAREIAAAMAYLHDRRILHADLTSNNILLAASEKDSRGYMAKVCDFGLSRVLGEQSVIKTQTHGTITHMPPEVLLDGEVSRAADVYAFGVILWEMYMGQRPWMGLHPSQIIHSISSGKQLPLGSSCPSSLRKVLLACMARKPEARPNFQEVLVHLEELEDDLVGH